MARASAASMRRPVSASSSAARRPTQRERGARAVYGQPELHFRCPKRRPPPQPARSQPRAADPFRRHRGAVTAATTGLADAGNRPTAAPRSRVHPVRGPTPLPCALRPARGPSPSRKPVHPTRVMQMAGPASASGRRGPDAGRTSDRRRARSAPPRDRGSASSDAPRCLFAQPGHRPPPCRGKGHGRQAANCANDRDQAAPTSRRPRLYLRQASISGR